MVCIYCGHSTKVVNSRLQRQTNNIWRRRQCLSCGAIFTTHESFDPTTSLLVQYPKTDPVPLSRDRLFLSIYNSCRHRPDALREAGHLTTTVLSLLLDQHKDAAVPVERIVTTATTVLERFDPTAATVYKAYHA
jgi:transcriptional repressor NrdR